MLMMKKVVLYVGVDTMKETEAPLILDLKKWGPLEESCDEESHSSLFSGESLRKKALNPSSSFSGSLIT